ncbi:hypothetical protein [Mesorhizobium sp. J428]|nr:hypothetical protein [Mesorhizobium sp. J428]
MPIIVAPSRRPISSEAAPAVLVAAVTSTWLPGPTGVTFASG